MPDHKTYLNVPFAEKDQAKTLGARWDPNRKKWYVPSGVELNLFARWELTDDSDRSNSAVNLPAGRSGSAVTGTQGARTFPEDKQFIAYDGDLPPWN